MIVKWNIPKSQSRQIVDENSSRVPGLLQIFPSLKFFPGFFSDWKEVEEFSTGVQLHEFARVEAPPRAKSDRRKLKLFSGHVSRSESRRHADW